MQAFTVLITVIVATLGGSCREDARRGVPIPSLALPTGGTANNSFVPAESPAPTLQLSFLNNLSSNVSLSPYVTGFDGTGRLIVLSPPGQWVYPQARSQTVPSLLASNLRISLAGEPNGTAIPLSGPLLAGRIWVARGDLQCLSFSRLMEGLHWSNHCPHDRLLMATTRLGALSR